MQGLFDLSGKVVAITGGAGILGSELSRGLAKAGAKIAVLDRNPADELVAEIKEARGDAVSIPFDALDRESLLQAREEILAKYGTIDILVNGVGGNSPSATTSPKLSFFDLPELHGHLASFASFRRNPRREKRGSDSEYLLHGSHTAIDQCCRLWRC